MTKRTVILIVVVEIILGIIIALVPHVLQLRRGYMTLGGAMTGVLFAFALFTPWYVNIWKTSRYIRYTCHHCSEVFKPTFYQFPSPYMIKHNFNKYLVKCPQCGKRDYMEFIKDEPVASPGDGNK